MAATWLSSIGFGAAGLLFLAEGQVAPALCLFGGALLLALWNLARWCWQRRKAKGNSPQ